MYHAINVRMLLENAIQGAINGNIDIVKLRPLAAEELDPIEGFLG